MTNKLASAQHSLGTLFADWADFVRELLWEKPWRLFLLLFALLAGYGGKLVTLSYNNDNIYDLVRSHPFFGLTHHRLGNVLFALIGLRDREIFFWSSWIGLGIMVMAGLLLAYYFYEVSSKRLKHGALLVLLLCFILYPLHMESMVYPGIGFGHLLVMLSLLLIRRLENGGRWAAHFLPAFLLAIAFSSYEVNVLVYGITVLAAIFLRICQGETLGWKNLWNTLWRYGFYLLVALLLWGTLTWILLTLNCYEPGTGPARDILWLSNWKIVKIALIRLISYFFVDYAFNSMFYFALLEFWLAVGLAVYFICCKKDRFGILSTILLLMLIAIFSLSLLQCKIQPYRVCQSFTVFVSFFLMMFYQWHGSGSKLVKIVFFFIILLQTKELALMTKFERESSEHASYCFKTLGHEIKKQFPNYAERKIIIVGSCREWHKIDGCDTLQLPIFYKYPSISYYQHIGKNQFYVDFHEQSSMLLEYHTGIKAMQLPEDELKVWRERVRTDKQPAWPAQGYINEVDGHIVVNMGMEEPVNDDSSILHKLRTLMRQRLGINN